VLNFKQLRDLLLSKDLSRNDELSWVSKNNYRFLDGEDMAGWHTTFTSFPRSGNSFLRRMLEDISGIFTGSDNEVLHTLDLQSMGLYGENHIGCEESRVWITKSHYPWKLQDAYGRHERQFTANRQICLIRNPLDIYPSFLNLMLTITHSLQPKEKYFKEFPEEFDQWMRTWVMPSIKNYYKRHTDFVGQQVPCYYLRYEDLITRPQEIMCELFCYLFNVESVEGTVLEQRITKTVAANSRGNSQVYALKQNYDYSKLLRNAHMYTPEQFEYVKDSLRETMLYFGYTSDPAQGGDHETAFFKYDDYTESEKELYFKFKQENKKLLA
jgi:hypothetical protein